METTEKRRPGRPRKYADAADKQRAYRERNDPTRLIQQIRSDFHRAHNLGVVIRLDPYVLMEGPNDNAAFLRKVLAETDRQCRAAEIRSNPVLRQYIADL